jgi:hypothetical protein
MAVLNPLAFDPAMAPEADAEEIRKNLERLSPRSAPALGLRLLEKRSRESCAGFFGISLDAFDVMLLRAARELAAVERGERVEPIGSYEEELNEARSLAAGRLPLASKLLSIEALAEPVKAQIEEAARANEASPKYRRETWLRRLVVVAIVAVTAWFYVQGQNRKTPPNPPPHPRSGP